MNYNLKTLAEGEKEVVGRENTFLKYKPILFSSFPHSNFKMKKRIWCAWDLNPGRRMLDADETTEL